MRVTPFVLMLGIAASTMSVPVAGQRADDQIRPQSVSLVQKGEALLAAGKYTSKPTMHWKRRWSPIRRIAQGIRRDGQGGCKQKLYGQAIRFTNRALLLEPTDREALKVQGEAMVEAGATARARTSSPSCKRFVYRDVRRRRLKRVDPARPDLGANKPATDVKKN